MVNALILEKKYELSVETKQVDGAILHRVKALIDFNDVKAGDLGGWVESESNLSQGGTCWVYDDAIVCDSAVVDGGAQIRQSACVVEKARVTDLSVVQGEVVIGGTAVITGSARINVAQSPGDSKLIADAAEAIAELFKWDGKVEELLASSEVETEGQVDGAKMLAALREFVEKF